MILDNQKRAKSLGYDIPGLTGGSGRSLTENAGGGQGGGMEGLYTPNVQSVGQMMSEFEGMYNPEKDTIMGAYSQARQQTSAAADAQRKLIESKYTGMTSDELSAGNQDILASKEAQRGFAQSPVMLSLMASETEKRIRGLQRDKAELLLSNDYEKASKISELIVNEQEAISKARVNMLNEYFGFQEEARGQSAEQRAALGFQTSEQRAAAEEERARLGFRTPEQTAVLALSEQYPDAGITEADTLQSAQNKVRQSPAYLQNMRAGEASIAQAWADVASSQASTQKTLSEIEAAAAAAPGTDPENFRYLQTVADDALKLAKASGQSKLGQIIGSGLIGDSKFNQLVGLTNTLKTNLMVLNTDPGIKKFFGPQMSNADVTLMASAATIMNPELNSPAQMYDEIVRVKELFAKMERIARSKGTSLSELTGGQVSGGAGGRIVDSPDGPIEIID